MKANITTMVRATVLGAALLLSSTAWAGWQYGIEVGIDNFNSYAYGAKADARYSADPTQYIGCSISAGASSTSVSVSCYARDKFSQYRSCYSTDPGIVEVVKTMPDYGYVRFRFDSAGKCTYLGSTNGSWMLP